MMSLIRWFLRKLILTANALFPPKTVTRTPEEQAKIDKLASNLILYQFEACPFCVKVRRALKRLGMNVELRDAKQGTPGSDELLKGGGKIQTPCLKIREADGSIRWLYESTDIIQYLTAATAS
jgi:glutaredoxin